MAIDIEKVEMIVMEADEKFDKSADVFKSDLTQVRAGRANPHVLDKIKVDYYGTPSPINQVGNIAVQDGQCLVISPWDKSLLKAIEKERAMIRSMAKLRKKRWKEFMLS